MTEAPKPEMLEKARLEGVASVICVRCVRHFRVPPLNSNEAGGGECPICALIDENHEWAQWREKWTATVDTYTSLLEKAERDHWKITADAHAKMLMAAQDITGSHEDVDVLVERLSEALRASEASVESLRKERDRWQFMYEDRGKALDRSAAARLTAEEALESARAEATKAALEKAAKIMCFQCMTGRGQPQKHATGTPGWWHAPTESWDWTHCESGPIHGALASLEPSSPTPPTSPTTMTGHDLAKAVVERFQPTPPSEEPRPDCPNCGLSWSNWQAKRCIGCGYTAIPSPEPSREEP